MQIIQVTENIIQLTRFRIFNAYLVKEDDGYTLVDTMIHGSGKSIIESIKKLRIEITKICITHAHSDHVGSLAYLASALPHAKRYISFRDGKFLAGDHSLESWEPQH